MATTTLAYGLSTFLNSKCHRRADPQSSADRRRRELASACLLCQARSRPPRRVRSERPNVLHIDAVFSAVHGVRRLNDQALESGVARYAGKKPELRSSSVDEPTRRARSWIKASYRSWSAISRNVR